MGAAALRRVPCASAQHAKLCQQLVRHYSKTAVHERRRSDQPVSQVEYLVHLAHQTLLEWKGERVRRVPVPSGDGGGCITCLEPWEALELLSATQNDSDSGDANIWQLVALLRSVAQGLPNMPAKTGDACSPAMDEPDSTTGLDDGPSIACAGPHSKADTKHQCDPARESSANHGGSLAINDKDHFQDIDLDTDHGSCAQVGPIDYMPEAKLVRRACTINDDGDGDDRSNSSSDNRDENDDNSAVDEDMQDGPATDERFKLATWGNCATATPYCRVLADCKAHYLKHHRREAPGQAVTDVEVVLYLAYQTLVDAKGGDIDYVVVTAPGGSSELFAPWEALACLAETQFAVSHPEYSAVDVGRVVDLLRTTSRLPGDAGHHGLPRTADDFFRLAAAAPRLSRLRYGLADFKRCISCGAAKWHGAPPESGGNLWFCMSCDHEWIMLNLRARNDPALGAELRLAHKRHAIFLNSPAP